MCLPAVAAHQITQHLMAHRLATPFLAYLQKPSMSRVRDERFSTRPSLANRRRFAAPFNSTSPLWGLLSPVSIDPLTTLALTGWLNQNTVRRACTTHLQRCCHGPCYRGWVQEQRTPRLKNQHSSAEHHNRISCLLTITLSPMQLTSFSMLRISPYPLPKTATNAWYLTLHH